jgi:MFS family permease
VVGLLSGVASVAAPVAGTAIDRFGARAVAATAGVALAGGYGVLAFATTPALAFAAATLGGIGNGALQPSQSALIAALAPRELRQRANAVSRVAVNVGAALGATIGGIVAAAHGFVALFVANAVTYLLYVAILLAAVRAEVRPEPVAGGYRVVVRDRALLRIALINVGMIAVGWGVLAWLVPVYAREIGIGSGVIGLVIGANAVTVVLAQIPIVRAAEGRSRIGALSLAALCWTVACLMVVVAHGPALLVVAAVLFGIGECLHATSYMPLVADLAPLALRGRYMAAAGLSWWLGLAVAPTVGAQLLAVSPTLALTAAAALAVCVTVALRAYGPTLPAALRSVPQPD